MRIDNPPTEPAASPVVDRRDARLAGVVSAGLALGVVELAGAVLPGRRPLPAAVGDAVVDASPEAVTRVAIDAFGTADKLVLLVGILGVCLLLGAVLGQAAARHRWAAPVGFAAAAALGVWAATADTQGRLGSALAAAGLGSAAGTVALLVLLRAAGHGGTPGGVAAGSDRPAPAPAQAPTAFDREGDRRSFLALAGGLSGLAVAAGVTGRFGPWPSVAEEARRRIVLPSRAGAALPPGAELAVPGISPIVTPTGDFYRIDTALLVPDVDPARWRLDVTGLVEHPFSLTYDDLVDQATLDEHVTIACVSNEVGGGLVGNARWLGVPLARILDRAGVDPATATQLVGRSVDGFTVGFPTEAALDGRAAMVAIGMNGEPLPRRHGFPARLIVPGLYGYVSATKWLESIELTTWDAFDAYWIPRGWAEEAPIKTQSRIDVPRQGSRPAPGPLAVAGVAWAPHVGVERVEVQVDDGPWRPADLSAPISDDAWRQWSWVWDAPPGVHAIRVRATDASGRTQTPERRPPAPDGATGWHERRVTIESA
ncbi:MAG: molybdopterin-dependent oxidoreductase [Acidimicrobiales bacterium]|nr:molybdopterin-dependent oxidoreductase [Acidimicrobiales bacterium]